MFRGRSEIIIRYLLLISFIFLFYTPAKEIYYNIRLNKRLKELEERKSQYIERIEILKSKLEEEEKRRMKIENAYDKTLEELSKEIKILNNKLNYPGSNIIP